MQNAKNHQFRQQLKERFLREGFHLTDIQILQFEEFYHFLIEKNKVMNLTAITDMEEVIEKHFIDSVSSSRIINYDNISNCIDVGTGAGFPGIPLKIVYPHISMVLLDSLNKRVKFLEEVIERLELKDIIAIHYRAEDAARVPQYREKFDLCVSRAVANLRTLSEYCIPFVKKKGVFLSYKSMKGKEEIKEAEHCLQLLASTVEKVDEFQLDDNAGRMLIKIRKNNFTPKKYPRKAGLPSKDPL